MTDSSPRLIHSTSYPIQLRYAGGSAQHTGWLAFFAGC